MRCQSGRWLVALALLTCTGGCSSAKFIQTGSTHSPRAEDCHIEVFSSKTPARAYEEIGILEGETGPFGHSLEKVLPKMKAEACSAGGDAIILTSRDRTMHVTGGKNTGVTSLEELNVTGTVIRWTDRTDAD
ncbi:MAG: hypothetical protein DHS20C21_21850 [Gemmatimonadota bacterium]|nr:MAG: hypothetical protein DHS20C21_21850 [Gemmatimonadota bacterium]